MNCAKLVYRMTISSGPGFFRFAYDGGAMVEGIPSLFLTYRSQSPFSAQIPRRFRFTQNASGRQYGALGWLGCTNYSGLYSPRISYGVYVRSSLRMVKWPRAMSWK